jgi:hypothetical protein
MKSDKLRIALETLKGSVSTETDAVKLTCHMGPSLPEASTQNPRAD